MQPALLLALSDEALRAVGLSGNKMASLRDLATSLGIQSVSVASLWQGAVARACSSGVAAYDTLFVELADREKLPLVTYDAAVLKAFPSIACRPTALLSR